MVDFSLMSKPNPSTFQSELAAALKGETLFDEVSRLLYSTDASLYQIKPGAVVVPRDREDVINAVKIAARHQVPLIGRGGGTSLAGQTVTSGLVLDFSKHMNQVLEVNEEEHWARVQPGIVLDNLNAYLKPYGLFFAPDVATASRANVGGMLGNNSSGVRSVKYGKTVDHVLELSVVLPSGEDLQFHNLSRSELEQKCASGGREGSLYAAISAIVDENRDEIVKRFPKVMRRVSGYNLDELLDRDQFNLAKLMVGSESTLGLVTEAKVNLVPIPPHTVLAVLHFDNLLEAIRSVQSILQYDPSAVEVLDRYGLELARDNPTVSALCSQFVHGTPDAVLIVEFSDSDRAALRSRFEAMKVDPSVQARTFHCYETWEPAAQQIVWQVRKNTLGVMLGIKGDFKPLPFIEDSCVPVEHLAEYVEKVQKICATKNRDMALYAHASVGVIHIRPLLNLKQAEDLDILRSISEEVFQLVLAYGGSWSGEHGDGLVRSYKIPEFFGDQIYGAFKQVKQAFDPAGLMNPGKILDSPSPTENLRIHPGYETHFPETYYRFESEGGFDLALEMCTGVGQCRKTLTGIMCPSYIATRDEEHSTRGRANALRSAIAGDLGPDGLTDKRVHEVLDLCLECKACKSECPSSVDMAKMKAEFLTHFHARHGVPIGKRLVAATRSSAEFASRMPRLANLVTGSWPFRVGLELVAGFDRRRSLPEFAVGTLSQWYERNFEATATDQTKPEIVLFGDTFSNFYEPGVGVAALKLFQALGFRVKLADLGCCGRPLISAGLLSRAKVQGNELVSRLKTFHPEAPIVVLEPSCYSTLKDDYLDLVDDREGARAVADRVFTLEELLSQEQIKARFEKLSWAGPEGILFHGHCQQKALTGSETSVQILSQVTAVEEVPAGCCGMAGSFGYEKIHYDLSEKIGAHHLLPAVCSSSPDTAIVIPGFSCRSQIRHFTGRRAVHPAELLFSSLKKGS